MKTETAYWKRWYTYVDPQFIYVRHDKSNMKEEAREKGCPRSHAGTYIRDLCGDE